MGTEKRGYFRIPADADSSFDRLGHFIQGHEPEGAIAISDNEARQLHDEITARTPPKQRRVAPDNAGSPADVQALQDQIDALAQAVIGQAKTLDVHAQQLTETAEVSQATKASVVEFMENVKGKTG